jgi:hypothetical protein
LPELHPGSGPADVEIALERSSSARDTGFSIDVHGESVRFAAEGITFTVTAGQRIHVVAPTATAEPDIRIWLLGTVMACLLHQRDYLPVHANVVEIPDRGTAAAFAAESGGGKSTMAAWLDARDYRVLTDDLCAIRTDGPVVPAVFEGIPRMKLWAETLEAFARDSGSLEKVASDLDKFHVPLSSAARTGRLDPLRLERLYVLDRSAEGAAFEITPLKGAEAAAAVLANAFRWQLGQMIQRRGSTQFDHCIALAQNTAVFRVRRAWTMERFDEQAGWIERHLMTPLEELRA